MAERKGFDSRVFSRRNSDSVAARNFAGSSAGPAEDYTAEAHNTRWAGQHILRSAGRRIRRQAEQHTDYVEQLASAEVVLYSLEAPAGISKQQQKKCYPGSRTSPASQRLSQNIS